MPITKTEQARIDLSRAQYKALVDIWRTTQEVSMSLEETNLPNTVALLSKNGEIKLIHHNGEVHRLGKK
jgi:hypothetical protein